MKPKAKLNMAEFRELRRSAEVKADLERRAKRVAAAAGPGFVARSQVGANRARASVATDTLEARRKAARDPAAFLRALERGR